MAKKRPRVWGDRTGRRADILEAARDVVREDGYGGLAIRAVAQKAGVALGTVYTFFSSKEELYVAVYTEGVEQLHKEIAPICASATTPEELFIGIADHYREFYRLFGRQLNVWVLMSEQSGISSEVATPLVQVATETMATIEAALARVSAAAGIEPGPDAALALPFLWATLNGLADHFTGVRHQLHPYNWDQMVAFAARTLVAGLTARSGLIAKAEVSQ